MPPSLSSPQDAPDDTLFSPDATLQWHAVVESEVWQHLRQGLVDARDALLAQGMPTTNQELWTRWAKVDLLSDLILRGPMLVVESFLLAQRTSQQSPLETTPLE